MAVDIQVRRRELNLTLEQIGNYVGVSKSTVKKWESGNIKNLRRDKIVLLSQILRVSPLDILDLNNCSFSTPVEAELSSETVKKIESDIGFPLSEFSLIYKSDKAYIFRSLTDIIRT